MNISNIPKYALHGKRLHIIRRLEILCEIINEGDKILDIGCGVGSYITDTLGYLPVKVDAIDYDNESIVYARKHNEHSNVNYILAEGEKYQSSYQYDVIVCSHVIEHSPEPDRILSNAKELLKDSGWLYMALPNGHGCFETENFIPRMIGMTEVGEKLIDKMTNNKVKDSLNRHNPHINFYTIGGITKLLKKNDFNIKERYNEQVIGGVVTDRTLLRLPKAEKVNLNIADRLPANMVNGWILLCQKT